MRRLLQSTTRRRRSRGWGGDQLFYQNHAFLAAGDYLHYRGLRPRVPAGRLRFGADGSGLRLACVARGVCRARSAASMEHPRHRVPTFMPLIRREVIDEVYGSHALRSPASDATLAVPRVASSGTHFRSMGPWEFYDPLGYAGRPGAASRRSYSQPVLEAVPAHPSAHAHLWRAGTVRSRVARSIGAASRGGQPQK